MSTLYGDQIKIEIRTNKKSGTYRVEILEHGSTNSCADRDAGGNSVHAKIVEAIAQRMGGNAGTAHLTLEGEKEVGMHERLQRTNPIAFDEDDNDDDGGYNPLDEESTKKYDTGYGV